MKSGCIICYNNSVLIMVSRVMFCKLFLTRLPGKEDTDEEIFCVGSFVLPVLRDCLC